MTDYILTTDNPLIRRGLPDSARRLDTQEWVMGLPNAPVGLQRACGYYAVTVVAKPADTTLTKYVRGYSFDGVTALETWTEISRSQDELDLLSQDSTKEFIRQRAITAIDAITPFLSNNTPTNAQSLAQIKLLTRCVNGLLRVFLAGTYLDSTKTGDL